MSTCPGLECCYPIFDSCESVFEPLTADNSCQIVCMEDTFDFSVNPTGGEGPYTYELVSGDIPPGLTWDPVTGSIVGTATQFGTFTFTIRITDLNQKSIELEYNIGVITIATVALDGYTIGVPYSFQLQGLGGSGVWRWEIVSGTLPDGLTMSDSGLITGTPTGNDPGTPVEIELELFDATCNSPQALGVLVDYDGNVLVDYDGNPIEAP